MKAVGTLAITALAVLSWSAATYAMRVLFSSKIALLIAVGTAVAVVMAIIPLTDLVFGTQRGDVDAMAGAVFFWGIIGVGWLITFCPIFFMALSERRSAPPRTGVKH
jgi:hypothetical protein